MLSTINIGRWKDGGISFRSHVPVAEMNRLEETRKPKAWQRPQWLKAVEQNAEQFVRLYPNEDGLHAVTPERQYQGMYRGRIHAARALAYIYWNILKDFWPTGSPQVAEMGCGSHLSLYEIFPHEDLPNQWHAFDMVQNHIQHASNIARFTRWPLQLTLGNAYLPPFERTDILIGQSSYDSVLRLIPALEAARPKVKYFVHFQEVNPLIEPIFHFVTDFPEQRRQWLTNISDVVFDTRFAEKARALFNKELTALTPEETSDIFALLFNNIIDSERESLAFRLPGGQFVGCQDEFQARLNFCLEKAGYKILTTGIAEGIYRGPLLRHHQNLPNITAQTKPTWTYRPNFYIRAGDWSKIGYQTDLSLFQETAYVRYVVAKA